MTKEDLKSKFPNTYAEIVEEGVKQERTRVKAQMELENSFNFKL